MLGMPSASDLPARVAARSRSEARIRTDRLSSRLAFIVQCGFGAALAWWVAGDLFDHTMPFFAPVTAIITLGMSYGQRVRRAVEVMIGVALGVLIGDVFSHVFGSGVFQLLIVVMVAMAAASLVGAGLLLTIQSGVQAAIITTLVAAPGQAFTRWLDAAIGGSVALVIGLLVPATGLQRPRQQAARVVEEIAAILNETVQVIRTGDTALAARTLERARSSESIARRAPEARLGRRGRRALVAVPASSPPGRPGDRGPARTARPHDPQPAGSGPSRKRRCTATRSGAGGIR